MRKLIAWLSEDSVRAGTALVAVSTILAVGIVSGQALWSDVLIGVSTNQAATNDRGQKCQPRPACLDARPACKIAEPAGGWCPTVSTRTSVPPTVSATAVAEPDPSPVVTSQVKPVPGPIPVNFNEKFSLVLQQSAVLRGTEIIITVEQIIRPTARSLQNEARVKVAVTKDQDTARFALGVNQTLPAFGVDWTFTGLSGSSAVFVANPAGAVSVKSFGALGDGVHDDRPAIQQAIDSLAGVGGGTIYVPAGTYRLDSLTGLFPGGDSTLDQSALIIKSDNIVLAGDPGHSTLLLGNGLKAHILAIDHAQNVTVEKLVFDGNKANRDGSTPYPNGDVVANVISVTYSSHVTIQQTEVRNGLEDGIGFWQSANGQVLDSNIHDNGTIWAGASGISYSGSRVGLIARNLIEKNSAPGVWGTYGTNDLTITYNTIRNNSGAGVALGGYGGAIPDEFYIPDQHFAVEDNVISGNGQGGFPALYVVGAKDGIVKNNQITDNFYDGIQLDSLQTEVARNWTITNNECSNTNNQRLQDFGIRVVTFGSDIQITGNRCRDNGTWLGHQILVQGSGVNANWPEVNATSYTPPKRGR